MRKLIMYTACSLDQFIARKDGSVDWLSGGNMELPDEDYGFAEFYSGVETLIMGARTWKHIRQYDYPYPGKISHVFTHDESYTDRQEIRFIREDLFDYVRELKMQKGGTVWLVGGGQINGQLLRASLVDEIILTVIPKLLGEGLPLFGEGSGGHDLRLSAHKVFTNGVVQLRFERREPKKEKDIQKKEDEL